MNLNDFLMKDYEVKVRFLTDQYQRMWTRFNFFVTIESAFIGGNLILVNGSFTPRLALMGAGLSFFWYVFGAQDRFLVRIYEQHVKHAARTITKNLEKENPTRRNLARCDREKTHGPRNARGEQERQGW